MVVCDVQRHDFPSGDYHIEKSQPFDITSIYNETDSIFLNMKNGNKERRANHGNSSQ
jgi:hypothetical protein